MLKHTYTYTQLTHTHARAYAHRQVSMNILFVYLSKLFTHFESEHILQRISILPRNKTQAVQAKEEEEDEEHWQIDEEEADVKTPT